MQDISDQKRPQVSSKSNLLLKAELAVMKSDTVSQGITHLGLQNLQKQRLHILLYCLTLLLALPPLTLWRLNEFFFLLMTMSMQQQQPKFSVHFRNINPMRFVNINLLTDVYDFGFSTSLLSSVQRNDNAYFWIFENLWWKLHFKLRISPTNKDVLLLHKLK